MKQEMIEVKKQLKNSSKNDLIKLVISLTHELQNVIVSLNVVKEELKQTKENKNA